MIKNIWNNIQFYCLNHDEPIPLYVYSGSETPFYACKKYMAKDEAHPEGHEVNETSCANRLSFNLTVSIIEKISKMMQEDSLNNEICDYTGFTFTYKNVEVKILEYSYNKGVQKIGILNQNEIEIWRN